MGLAAVVFPSASPASAVPLHSVEGAAAGMFITALLVFLLAYLNILEASERNRPQLRSLLVTMIFPLAVVFTAILVYESLAVLELL